MAFRLVTFGDLRLTGSDGRTLPYPEKALILIAYLLTAKGGERSRSEIAQFLWDEVDPSRASANLRTLLLRVRNQQAEFEAELLIVRESSVSLNAEEIESDFADFDRYRLDPVGTLTAFLENCHGLFLSGADTFSAQGRDWITTQREKVVTRVSGALNAVAAIDIEAHNALIRESAHRLLLIEPQCEAAYRTLMKVYAASGHLHSARATFGRLRERLKEFQVSPEQSTLDLLRQIAPVEPQLAVAEKRGPSDAKPGSLAYLPRVAVLPPVNVTIESLLPALIEDVTLGLCAFKTIAVVAPHTASRIAAEADRTAAYQRHAISYVLDTRISAQNGNGALFAQLVDVDNDATVWAERFDIGVDALSRQYHAISRRIAASIASQVEQTELDRLGFQQHPNAYQYYLMGQRFLKRIDLPDIRRARKAFRLSVRQDPRFAAALAGLARTDHMEWLLTARGDDAFLKSSEQFATQAIMANAEGSGGYRELGVARLFRGAFDDSIEAFERAQAASPCHADLIADYADTLVHSSDPARGLAKIETALELNPLAPDVYHWTAAGANYFLERYEAALACLSRMEDQSHISRMAAACWGMLGDRKKAGAHKRKTMATHPGFDIETWLSIIPIREQWQKDHYREGLRKAGFS